MTDCDPKDYMRVIFDETPLMRELLSIFANQVEQNLNIILQTLNCLIDRQSLKERVRFDIKEEFSAM